MISGTYFLLGWPGVVLIVIIPLGIRMGWTTILDEAKKSPPKEEIKKSESEWGFDRVFYRLFLYPIAIGLIILGMYMLFNSEIGENTFLAIVITTIASIYLIADIAAIIDNRK